MFTRLTVMLLFVVVLGALSPTGADAPRVALRHGSYGDYRHRDDYDGSMKELGWQLDKFENKNFGELVARLDQYDLILGTALYNYALNVQDFSIYRQELQAFMARGGAIVWTDTNYPDHVDWLAKWGPEWAVGLAPCPEQAAASQWLDRSHAVFSSVSPMAAAGGTWMHMVPGSGWEVLSRCGDDGATSLFRAHGRGFMLLSNFWPHPNKQLRNIWGALQYTRAGVLPRLPDVTGFSLGDNPGEAAIRNLTDDALEAVVTLTVQRGDEKPQPHRMAATVPPGATVEMTSTVPLGRRATYTVDTEVQVNGQPVIAGSRVEVVIPELMVVELVEPRYRGVAMMAAPPERIRAEVTLHPFGEDLAGAAYAARLWRGGEVAAETRRRPLNAEAFSLSLPFKGNRDAPAVLEVELVERATGRLLAGVRREIPVIPPRPNQVFIDEDLNTRVDGELFFPIAVYHIPADKFAVAKEMGFNTVQAWGRNPEEAGAQLEAARHAGVKVIIEGMPHAANDGNMANMDPTVTAHRDHPALLAWYLTDEPSGDERLAWCHRVRDYLTAMDPNHPVFLTSCVPGEFHRYVWATDIFAVDPYPIPIAPVEMVSGWMKTAQRAAQGRKPVWLIPQLHNWAAYSGKPEEGRYPTPDEERNMVYQGLVWGAKAVFYYPWDDGPTGMTHDPELMAAVREINGELAVLGPELLRCRHQVTARGTGSEAGLYAAVYRGPQAAYVIAVNVTNEAREFAVPTGLSAGPVEVMFGGDEAEIGADGKMRTGFAPLGVRVYRVASRAARDGRPPAGGAF